jgi:DNA-binding NarL/FixJ family response regulator
MSSARLETAQLLGAVAFADLTARDRSSAGSQPEEIEELVAAYLAGATALALAGKHSIHRTTVLALLERHQVARRGRVLTPGHIERAVSAYASGRSCASIAKDLKVNPETVRQALLKAGVAMRRPGGP